VIIKRIPTIHKEAKVCPLAAQPFKSTNWISRNDFATFLRQGLQSHRFTQDITTVAAEMPVFPKGKR
jgi:hypothetical protein